VYGGECCRVDKAFNRLDKQISGQHVLPGHALFSPFSVP
jgi:hypothetical protein